MQNGSPSTETHPTNEYGVDSLRNDPPGGTEPTQPFHRTCVHCGSFTDGSVRCLVCAEPQGALHGLPGGVRPRTRHGDGTGQPRSGPSYANHFPSRRVPEFLRSDGSGHRSRLDFRDRTIALADLDAGLDSPVPSSPADTDYGATPLDATGSVCVDADDDSAHSPPVEAGQAGMGQDVSSDVASGNLIPYSTAIPADHRGDRSVKWVFTWNNYPADFKEVCQRAADYVRPGSKGPGVYIAFSEEVAPDTGTPHLQGFLRFPHAVRFGTVRSLFTTADRRMMYAVYFAVMQGTFAQSQAYCTKVGSLQEYGVQFRPEIRSEAAAAARKARRANSEKRHHDLVAAAVSGVPWYQLATDSEAPLIRNHSQLVFYLRLQAEALRRLPPPTTPVEFIVVSGPPGVGKTHFVWHELLGGDDRDCLSVAGGGDLFRWFDGGEGKSTLWIDELHQLTQSQFSLFLAFFNPGRRRLEVKGGMFFHRFGRIIISTASDLADVLSRIEGYGGDVATARDMFFRRISRYVALSPSPTSTAEAPRYVVQEIDNPLEHLLGRPRPAFCPRSLP